jgi:hypothetical protein
VNADGAVRWVTVARVRVGLRPKPSATNGQLVEPGLAVDPAGARVFLVQATGPTAEVHLAELAVDYHPIRVGGRQLAAARKEFRGPWRDAQYLGDGLIAVSGYNGVRKGAKFAFVAAGVTVVDSHDWTGRVLDRTATWFTFASPLLLVIHTPDVVAYSSGGQIRFQLRIGQPLGFASAVGRYAYVWLADNRVAVVDVAAGTLVDKSAATSLTPIALAPP